MVFVITATIWTALLIAGFKKLVWGPDPNYPEYAPSAESIRGEGDEFIDPAFEIDLEAGDDDDE